MEVLNYRQKRAKEKEETAKRKELRKELKQQKLARHKEEKAELRRETKKNKLKEGLTYRSKREIKKNLNAEKKLVNEKKKELREEGLIDKGGIIMSIMEVKQSGGMLGKDDGVKGRDFGYLGGQHGHKSPWSFEVREF